MQICERIADLRTEMLWICTTTQLKSVGSVTFLSWHSIV